MSTQQDAEALARKKRRHRNERIVAAVIVLIVAGAAAGIVRWRRIAEEEYSRQTAYIPKPAVVTPEVELLAEYLRIDSSTVEGAATASRWMARQLEQRGLRPELIESAPGRFIVYARIRGREPGNGLLLFNHVDVVPPGNGWSHPPFEARIVANQIYGRGAIDMKGVAVAQLLAMADVAASGARPAHDLVFLATPDEETGSRFGMKWIVEKRRDLLDGVGYGITEGGVTEMLTEQMTYFGIEIGGKQIVETVVGAESLDAVRRARIALEDHVSSRFPERVMPEVRRFFQYLAPTRVSYRSHLADIDATIRAGRFWQLPASYRDLTQNSLWMGEPYRDGNLWAMRVRLIDLPDEDPDRRLAWLKSRLEPQGVRLLRVEEKGAPLPFSSSDTPLFRLLAKKAEDRYRTTAGTQILYRSTSDARFLRPLGIRCYGVSPFPVDIFQSVTVHRPDERVRLDYFNDGVEYMREVVQEWAEGD
jgi:acetylornithine deacetylase/succinyl-diaminopimelate desuccinylase-like protein